MTASMSSPWSKPRRRRSLGAMLLVAAVPAHAEDDGVLDTLQLHGFLSQALVVTDDNDVFGPSSDGGSLEFTEIGANVSLRPHEDVLIAAQVLSRRAGGERGDAEPKLDYGLIDYQLQSNQQRNVGVQLGRFKNPFGFYNQTRDVAFTRPGILLPQSIYFDRTRSLALSGDGLSVYHEEHLANGTLRSQIGFGRSRVEDDVDRALGMERLPGAFEPDTSAIGQIRYEHDGGRIITALSAADANAGYDSPGDFPGDGKFQFQPWVFSFQYNQELWSLTAEYAIRQLSLEGFNGIADTQKTGESWYLQYQRRFLDDWQWLVRYDHLVNDRDDPSGNDYAAAGAGPGYSQFAKDWTLGLQWRLTPRVLLSGEYHYIDGTAWLPPQDDLDPSETERYWNMLLFQVALRF